MLHSAARVAALCAALAVVVFMAGVPLHATPHSGLTAAVDTPAASGSVTIGGVTSTINSTGFWGAVGQFGANAPTPRVEELANSTPLHVFRFSDGMDSTNLTAGVSYSSSGSAGGLDINIPGDWSFCESLATRCTFVAQLPGETNRTGDVRATMQYFVAHGISPAYYSIGNEPQSWCNFNRAWTSWTASSCSAPTAIEYAREVQTMIPVIHSVVPSAKIIGIESVDCFNDSFIQEVALVDGPNITAIACHSYPANSEGTAGAGVQQFYNTLTSADSYNIASVAGKSRNATDYLCHICSGIPIWVEEFNAVSNVSSYAPFTSYMETFPDVVLTAGSVIQALAGGFAQLLFFGYWTITETADYGMLSGSGATVRPVYDFFSYFAGNMSSGSDVSVYATADSASVGPGLAVYVANSTTGSLLVVNGNATNSVSVTLPGGLPYSYGGQTVYWDNSTATPTAQAYAPLPSTATLGPHSVLLVDVSLVAPSGGTGSSGGSGNSTGTAGQGGGLLVGVAGSLPVPVSWMEVTAVAIVVLLGVGLALPRRRPERG
jgi:hypothetical protein